MPVGSSPRVRGKPVQVIPDIRLVGLIPARAGKTTAPPGADAHSTAHPRACGENCHEDRRRSRYGGSSPRVRGKLGGVGHCPEAGWLIPARAGKTYLRFLRTLMNSAHPRACGENDEVVAVVVPFLGSSPRGRGKPHQLDQMARDPGLIPARAGKTSIPGRAGHPWGAHPRACGENVPSWPAMVRYAGSSPRVRGKRDVGVLEARDPGLIPACAGKTSGRSGRSTVARAHPRVCGENPMYLPSGACS